MIGLGKSMSYEGSVFKEDGTKPPMPTLMPKIYTTRGRVDGVLTVIHCFLYSVSICLSPIIYDHTTVNKISTSKHFLEDVLFSQSSPILNLYSWLQECICGSSCIPQLYFLPLTCRLERWPRKSALHYTL